MPVQTRSTTHAHSMVSSEKPSASRKRTKQSENGDTASSIRKEHGKIEPEAGENLEFPQHDIGEGTETKKPKIEHDDINKCPFTPGGYRFPE